MNRMPVVASGPSGVGKGTLLTGVMDSMLCLGFSVSHTTRLLRPNEDEGVHYFFRGVDEFIRMKDAGEFVEWAEVHGNWYGTSIQALEEMLASGKDVLLDIDVQGQRQVKDKRPDALSIFIIPPSKRVLMRRLTDRMAAEKQRAVEQGKVFNESKSVIDFAERMNNARGEIESFLLFDYVVENDILEHAVEDLAAIIRVERARRNRGAHVASADSERAERLTVKAMAERVEILLREF